VPENFFTVAGVSSPATNLANSGVITVIFPATAPEETNIPSTNYSISSDCVFSSPDVSNAYGNSWAVVEMCNCSSPANSDDIKNTGIDMKICGFGPGSGINQTCNDVGFYRHGSKNKWVYPAVYITKGVCGIAPPEDITPPTVSSFYPTDSSTDIPVDVQPTLTFSKAIDSSTIKSSNIQLREYSSLAADSNVVPTTITLGEDGITVKLILSTLLQYNKQYYFFIGTGVKDIAGNSFAKDTWYHAQKNDHEFITSIEQLPL
jgi:hypothetical protein